MKKRIFVLILCAVGMSSLLASCVGGTGRSVTNIPRSAVGQSQQEADGTQPIAGESTKTAATTDPNAGGNAQNPEAVKPEEETPKTTKSETTNSESGGYETEGLLPGSHEGNQCFYRPE